MGVENDGNSLSLTAIYIDLKERSISFEAEDKTVAKLTLAASGTLHFHSVDQARAGERALADPAETKSTPPVQERQPTITVTGRLKTKPREGNPDARGNRTVFARLAVHQEGEQEAHMYLATFHRHTARIALSLSQEAQITVQGYPHSRAAERRLDTLSVVNILNYPGREQRRR